MISIHGGYLESQLGDDPALVRGHFPLADCALGRSTSL
jgi:glutathione S-transferase